MSEIALEQPGYRTLASRALRLRLPVIRGLAAPPLWAAICLLSLWLTAVHNAPLFAEVARVAGPPAADNLVIYAGLTAALFLVYNLLLGLLAWPWVLKPAATVLLLVGAIAA